MSLSEDTAKLRSTIIRKDSISYNYHLILNKDGYFGLAEIAFYIQSLAFEQLPIDFSGAGIDTLIVNNLEVPAARADNLLIINKALLQKGRNRIQILYDCTYDNDKTGCISFWDSNKQYVFTKFEPYFANRVFPSFDQPNLKAPMTLSVVAPTSWRVVGNEHPMVSQGYTSEHYLNKAEWNHNESKHLLVKHLKRVGEGTKTTLLPQTEKLPTYLYGFIAGEFAKITYDSLTWTGPPLSLYCVPTSQEYLKNLAPFIFDITTKSMVFYQNFFGVKYPFSKYDQAWVREFKSTAMENAAIVIFNEQKAMPRNPTQTELFSLGNTVSHELSHHWFGNYVTMNWWDDVWLNESFADFISHYCLESIKNDLDVKFPSSLAVFRDRKAWGYDDDECTQYTHAIRGIVANTAVASSIFDGITYAKGASTMKQLLYLVGEANFSTALTDYFNEYAWGNATIFDLLKYLNPYFPLGIDTTDWSDKWLLKPSVNVFETVRDPNNIAVNAPLLIKQTPFANQYPYLRYHKVKIAFFDANAQTTEIKQVLLLPQESTTIKFDASKGVSAIFLNYADESFLQNIIDPASLSFFLQKIDKITDFYTRTQIWYNIASMVKLAFLPLSDYVNFLYNKLFSEPSNFILEKMLLNVLSAIKNYLPFEERDAPITILCDKILSSLRNEDGVERQLILQKYYVEFSTNEEQVQRLVEWLRGKDTSLLDKPMNSAFRWKAVIKAYGLRTWSNQEKQTLFTEVKAKDSSSAADDAKLVCDAIIANDLQFISLYNSFKNESLSLSVRSLKASGWRSEYHRAKLISIRDTFFDDIMNVYTSLKYEGFLLFYSELRPIDDDLQYQIIKYKTVIQKLLAFEGTQAHVANIKKIVDVLVLRQENYAFHSDLNSTLTHSRAINRHSLIRGGSIKYNVHLAFNHQNYSGLAEVTFELIKIPKVLPIDFKFKEAHSLIINGNAVSADSIRNGLYLSIPRIYLKIGVNSIGVQYTNEYDNDSIGCLKFLDTSEDIPRTYVYTTFEPHAAHRLFACFDQPNLKAQISFNIVVPQGWVAVANTYQSNPKAVFSPAAYSAATQSSYPTLRDEFENSVTQPSDFYVFPATETLSTYLYCLAVGEYASISIPVDKRYNNLPMTLYCLNSYYRFMNDLSKFIFQFTIESIKFYEDKFKVDYPFKKYDYIFCHEYKFGAMENPGIVTFTDNYLYQQAVSTERMVRFGYVIAHECAHMWFGDLVTMDWWDDLWLNESFADFIGYFCIENIKDNVQTLKYNSGLTTMLGSTVSGYREDQMTTTHPVRSVVPNVSLAMAYFDSITYQKGAATLKQLMFLMGEGNFFSGLQDYFKDYAWKNGTIDTFLAYLSPYFFVEEFTLDEWKKDWLQTSSLNVLTPVWDPTDKSQDAKLHIMQTAFTPVYPTLRYHQVKVVFFTADGKFDEIIQLIGKQNETIITYSGNKDYKAILINGDGQDFVKVNFDAQSVKFFSENLNKVQNILNRMVIWHYLNESVRDASLEVSAFVDTALALIFDEPEDSIFTFEFNFLQQSTSAYLPILQRPAVKTRIYNKLLARLQSNETQVIDSDNRITMFKDLLPLFATTNQQIDFLEEWRMEKVLQKFPIAPSQAWNVVKLIYTSTTATTQQKADTLASQTSKNPGVKAQMMANTCDALSADADRFGKLYESFKLNATSVESKKPYAAGWAHPIHLDWLKANKAEYFADIEFLQRSLESNQFEFFYTYLQPIDDDLADNIEGYNQLKITGSDMEGHRTQIRQIVDEYEVRQALYDFNK